MNEQYNEWVNDSAELHSPLQELLREKRSYNLFKTTASPTTNAHVVVQMKCWCSCSNVAAGPHTCNIIYKPETSFIQIS